MTVLLSGSPNIDRYLTLHIAAQQTLFKQRNFQGQSVSTAHATFRLDSVGSRSEPVVSFQMSDGVQSKHRLHTVPKTETKEWN